MNFQDIQQLLEADEFVTRFEKASSETFFDRLLVVLNDELSLYLELIFIPVQDEIEDIRLLQFFVGLPVEFTGTSQARLGELFLHLNTRLPVGGFGLKEDESQFYYRYVLALSDEKQPRDESVLLQVVWVVFYIVETFAPSIQAVAKGEKTLDEVLS